jgi:hypothetical protein
MRPPESSNDEKVALKLESHLFGPLKADFSGENSPFNRTHRVLEFRSWSRFFMLGGGGFVEVC